MMLAVMTASAQTVKTTVNDSISTTVTGRVSFQNVNKQGTPVKGKKLSRKERKKLMKEMVVVSAVPDCYGGHDSIYHVYKDSFNTIKPLRKDTLTTK